MTYTRKEAREAMANDESLVWINVICEICASETEAHYEDIHDDEFILCLPCMGTDNRSMVE